MSFVVYLITYTNETTCLKYIGHTSLKKWDEGYYGSVSSQKYKIFWKNEVKHNKRCFTRSILSKHETRADALAEEYRLHILHDVVNSPDFVNMTLATSTKFSMKDRSHSEETKRKIGNSNTGSKRSHESRKLMSASAKGKILSVETKAKMSKVRIGVPKSIESNIKRSNSLKGRIISQECKDKISITKLGKKLGPQEKLTCPHCNNISGKSAAKRHHFDNCKFKPLPPGPAFLREVEIQR